MLVYLTENMIIDRVNSHLNNSPTLVLNEEEIEKCASFYNGWVHR